MGVQGPATSDIKRYVDEISENGRTLQGAEGEAQRETLLASARKLVSTLESPIERVARIVYQELCTHAALRVLIDMKVFQILAGDDGSPKSVDNIAKATGTDPVLVSRLLKHVATADIVSETGPNEYKANGVTLVLASDEGSGAFKDCYGCVTPAGSKIAEFFRKTNYRSPTDKDVTPWRYGSGSQKHYFEWLFSPGNEELAQDLQNNMKFKNLSPKWYETTDIAYFFPKDFESDKPLLVDVGGNNGHDLLGFHRAFPDQPGRLILQDLPGALEKVNKDEIKPLEAMPHDFFTPQPVKGARAYYLKFVLHDWPDEQCKEILSNLKPALEPGYSKILINDIIIPAEGADWFSTSVDMLMMLCHAAKERTEEEWRNLIESAGLKVVKIWPCKGSPEKLIEVELA